MSEENNNNQDRKPGNKFTFNSYWIYGSIILGLIIFNLMFLGEMSTETINFQKFSEMVAAGDVAKLEVVNKKDARIYIKKESLSKPQYKKLEDSAFGKSRPHYVFNIGPPEAFATQINDLNARVTPEQRIYPDYV